MGIRADLKDHLTTELGDGVTVYSAGEALAAVPAVIINPAEPYLVPVTFARNPNENALAVGLMIHLVVGAGGLADDRLNELEELRKRVTDAIHSGFVPAGQWASFGAFGTTTIGEIDHATAVIEYVFRAADDGTL